jgi:hypothetical protein
MLCAQVLTFAVTQVAAQDITGALQGTVVSPDGKPEPEVRIVVAGPNLQGKRETTTDRTGFFQFLALPPGGYVLNVTRVGLRPLEVREIAVQLGRTTAVGALTVETQPVEMAPLVVERAKLKLDPVHTTAGGNLSAKDYDALPVDRDYKSLITVLPHANQSYRGDAVNVGGSTGLENQFYIDGVNVTDAAFSDRATNLPHDFVRTVDVKSGGYEAQYGRALGAIVNAVTYSGTNDFESSVFGFVQPVALSMTPRATSTIAERGAVDYDYGARLSGPVVRDRLWFSAALNPRVDRVEKQLAGFGFYTDKTSAMRYASKLTWRAHSSTSVELSVFGDPTTQDAVLAPPAGITSVLDPEALLYHVESGGTVASLRATVAPSPSMLLQATLAGQWDRNSQQPVPSPGNAFPYTDYVNGSIEGPSIWPYEEKKGRMSASTRTTFMRRHHTTSAGVEYEDAVDKSGFDAHYIQRLDATTWMLAHEAYDGKFHNRSPAAYLQDTWQITDRFAANAGLRWSGQYMSGASGHTAQKITDEWQPRVGFTWQPGRAGAQRVFGSYGRFYQMLPTNIPRLWFVDYLAMYSYYSSDPRIPGAVPDDVIDGSSKEADYAKQIPGLHAENFDEFTLGYERLLGPEAKLTVRGMRRDLRSSFEWGVDLSRANIWVLGTPGKGDFSFLPPPKREYSALEVAAEGTWRRVNYRTSYVLSRTRGNFPGLFNSDQGYANPGQAASYSMPHQAVNSSGLMPNDHTHVFKLSTACETGFGLTSGVFLTFESGSPVNELAAGPWGPLRPAFVVPRGSAGRTPALWNLDLRLTYALRRASGPRTQIQADVLHIGNPRRATRVDEVLYPTLDANGNPDTLNPNTNYGHPLSYQPPMAGRIGLRVSF